MISESQKTVFIRIHRKIHELWTDIRGNIHVLSKMFVSRSLWILVFLPHAAWILLLMFQRNWTRQKAPPHGSWSRCWRYLRSIIFIIMLSLPAPARRRRRKIRHISAKLLFPHCIWIPLIGPDRLSCAEIWSYLYDSYWFFESWQIIKYFWKACFCTFHIFPCLKKIKNQNKKHFEKIVVVAPKSYSAWDLKCFPNEISMQNSY